MRWRGINVIDGAHQINGNHVDCPTTPEILKRNTPGGGVQGKHQKPKQTIRFTQKRKIVDQKNDGTPLIDFRGAR